MKAITVATDVNATREKVWEFWNNPEHITNWAFASDDWCAPYAENDLRIGGKFKTTMAAKDGSSSFDFEGMYSDVAPLERIEYTMADGRRVQIAFEDTENGTRVTETFDTEDIHTEEEQRFGWQSILENFKAYAESHV